MTAFNSRSSAGRGGCSVNCHTRIWGMQGSATPHGPVKIRWFLVRQIIELPLECSNVSKLHQCPIAPVCILPTPLRPWSPTSSSQSDNDEPNFKIHLARPSAALTCGVCLISINRRRARLLDEAFVAHAIVQSTVQSLQRQHSSSLNVML